MLRPKGKATRIAFEVLGAPINETGKKTKKQKKINEQLVFQETARVR